MKIKSGYHLLSQGGNGSGHEPGAPISAVFVWLLVLLAGAHCTATAAQVLQRDYRLEIIKSERKLLVMNGTELIREFPVSHGKDQGGKRRLGDNKTPIGQYKIMDFKADSKFFYFMQIDYPNLLDAWHGYKNRIITSTEFRQIAAAMKNNKIPPQDTGLGGYIGIHGLGEVTPDKLEIHDSFNWTEGCVALKNEEIDELRRYVSIGTSIVIRE